MNDAIAMQKPNSIDDLSKYLERFNRVDFLSPPQILK